MWVFLMCIVRVLWVVGLGCVVLYGGGVGCGVGVMGVW